MALDFIYHGADRQRADILAALEDLQPEPHG